MPSEHATIYVIDDDEAVRHSLAFLLQAAKFTVKTYGSATAFLNVVASLRGGCIIADVRMPEINGIDLLKRLGELKVSPGNPRPRSSWPRRQAERRHGL